MVEFIKNEDYKYVRALGAYYLRLTGRPVEIYQYLEPLYNDYRKVRVRLRSGAYDIVRMDEWIDELLTTDMVRCLTWPNPNPNPGPIAADPAREGDRGGVHQERGLQVRARARRLLPAPDR